MLHNRYGIDKQHLVIMTVVIGEISEVFALTNLNYLHFHITPLVLDKDDSED